jgi:hypothetical protein
VTRLGPQFQDAVDTFVGRLKACGVGENAPRPGEPMTKFVLPDETGQMVTLDSLLQNGPVAITFHRSGARLACSWSIRMRRATSGSCTRISHGSLTGTE